VSKSSYSYDEASTQSLIWSQAETSMELLLYAREEASV
jgi:hypothetical protein